MHRNNVLGEKLKRDVNHERHRIDRHIGGAAPRRLITIRLIQKSLSVREGACLQVLAKFHAGVYHLVMLEIRVDEHQTVVAKILRIH
jgi:hypothetical protein